MPFSSVLGASSVIKPGVCTSTTRPTVPYEGQLIYETDTDKVAAWNGSAWVYTHSSGLVLISSTTIGSAVSSVTVSNVFNSTYDNYMISISGGVGSSSNTGLTMQLGTASLTTSGYSWGGSAGSSSGVSGVGAANTTSWTVGDVNTNAIYLSMRINNPNLAKYTFFEAQSWNEANGNSRSLSGVQASTTQFTGFQLAPGTGTLTGGIIRVYGYSNS